MAKKRMFLIIVPVNKPAYAKEFGSQDKAWQHITDKCGRVLHNSEALANGEEYTAVSGCSKKKLDSQFNRRASEMCGTDVFGHAVLSKSFDDDMWEGFSLNEAEAVTAYANEM